MLLVYVVILLSSNFYLSYLEKSRTYLLEFFSYSTIEIAFTYFLLGLFITYSFYYFFFYYY